MIIDKPSVRPFFLLIDVVRMRGALRGSLPPVTILPAPWRMRNAADTVIEDNTYDLDPTTKS